MARRYDYAQNLKFERTEQGGMRAQGALTRVGLFRYRRKDGSIRVEYRPAEEVFNPESIASLEDAPITDMHPDEMVNGENFQELSVGHVRDVKPEGDLLVSSVVVQAKKVVDQIPEKRRDFSCGYSLDYDPTPGTYKGERYDGVQRKIRYNHVAILPPGGGRAGSDVRLRLDADDAEEVPCEVPISEARKDCMTPEEIAKLISGKDLAIAAAEKARLEKESAEKLAASEKTRADKAEAEADGLRSKLEASEKARKDSAGSERARINSRIALEKRASLFLGSDYKYSEKSDDEIRRDSILSVDKDAKLKDSSDYLEARFDGLDEPKKTEQKSQQSDKRAATKTRADSIKASNPFAREAREDEEDGEDEPEWARPLQVSK